VPCEGAIGIAWNMFMQGRFWGMSKLKAVHLCRNTVVNEPRNVLDSELYPWEGDEAEVTEMQPSGGVARLQLFGQ
jgi:hypothetical protein